MERQRFDGLHNEGIWFQGNLCYGIYLAATLVGMKFAYRELSSFVDILYGVACLALAPENIGALLGRSLPCFWAVIAESTDFIVLLSQVLSFGAAAMPSLL